MKRFASCLLVLFALAIPGISLAEPDLSGNWSLVITSVDPDGNVASHTVPMTLQQASPGFYWGSVTGMAAPFMTMVQRGADVRFTISCTNQSAAAQGEVCDQFLDSDYHRTRTWGTGIADMNHIDVLWSDDIGLAGAGKGVRQR